MPFSVHEGAYGVLKYLFSDDIEGENDTVITFLDRSPLWKGAIDFDGLSYRVDAAPVDNELTREAQRYANLESNPIPERQRQVHFEYLIVQSDVERGEVVDKDLLKSKREMFRSILRRLGFNPRVRDLSLYLEGRMGTYF